MFSSSSFRYPLPLPDVAMEDEDEDDAFATADSTTNDDDDDNGGEVKAKAGLLSLPEEIHSVLLTLIDPEDVLNYARTCSTLRRYADNQQVW